MSIVFQPNHCPQCRHDQPIFAMIAALEATKSIAAVAVITRTIVWTMTKREATQGTRTR